MLVRQACVVRPDLPDDPMALGAVWAFRFVVGHAAYWGRRLDETVQDRTSRCMLTADDNCGCT